MDPKFIQYLLSELHIIERDLMRLNISMTATQRTSRQAAESIAKLCEQIKSEAGA